MIFIIEMITYSSNVGNDVHVDIGSLTSKLMSFALSFGRMGMDFRPLIAEMVDEFVTRRFSLKVQNAAEKLVLCKFRIHNLAEVDLMMTCFVFRCIYFHNSR